MYAGRHSFHIIVCTGFDVLRITTGRAPSADGALLVVFPAAPSCSELPLPCVKKRRRHPPHLPREGRALQKAQPSSAAPRLRSPSNRQGGRSMPRQSESTRRKYAGFSTKNTTAPRRKHARHVLSTFFGSPKRTETRYDIRGSQPRRPPRRKRQPHPPSLLRRDVRSPLGQAPHSFLRRYNGKMRRFF